MNLLTLHSSAVLSDGRGGDKDGEDVDGGGEECKATLDMVGVDDIDSLRRDEE